MAIQELSKQEIGEVSGGALDLGGLLTPVLGVVNTVIGLVTGLVGTVISLVGGILDTVVGLVGGLLGGLGA